jgi:hypothetical protein
MKRGHQLGGHDRVPCSSARRSAREQYVYKALDRFARVGLFPHIARRVLEYLLSGVSSEDLGKPVLVHDAERTGEWRHHILGAQTLHSSCPFEIRRASGTGRQDRVGPSAGRLPDALLGDRGRQFRRRGLVLYYENTMTSSPTTVITYVNRFSGF